jgi:hypothetical protein
MRRKQRKALTATEYLLFNDMINRIRNLENVAKFTFGRAKKRIARI